VYYLCCRIYITSGAGCILLMQAIYYLWCRLYIPLVQAVKFITSSADCIVCTSGAGCIPLGKVVYYLCCRLYLSSATACIPLGCADYYSTSFTGWVWRAVRREYVDLASTLHGVSRHVTSTPTTHRNVADNKLSRWSVFHQAQDLIPRDLTHRSIGFRVISHTAVSDSAVSQTPQNLSPWGVSLAYGIRFCGVSLNGRIGFRGFP
jgi:hypothetical protein